MPKKPKYPKPKKAKKEISIGAYPWLFSMQSRVANEDVPGAYYFIRNLGL